MALSGNFNTTKYTTASSGTIGLNLSWTATQSVANNSSVISWTLKSNGTMSSGYSVYGGPITVVIGGKTVYSQTSRIRVYGSGAFKKTGTVTIAHNEDGTKSISMSVKAALYSASVNCTGSASYTLNTINRYAIIGSVDNFTDESYPSITYSNPAGTSLTTDVKVRITWNNGANYTAWHSLADDGSDSPYTFDSTSLTSQNIADMLASCSNSNTLAVQFDLQSTMDGTDYHHYKDAVMNVVNANPSASALTYEDTDSSVIAKTGDNQKIVQAQSTLVIHRTASIAKKSATIASYSLNFNGVNYTPDESGNVTIVKPNIAGVYAATITTTDSRGNTTSNSINITILELALPNAIYSLQRVSNFYTETTLNVDGKISSVGGTNVLTIIEKHRKIGDATWSTPASVPDATDTTLQLDNLYEWEVMVTVSDSYNSVQSTLTIGKGIPIAFFDRMRHSVGINGFPDEDEQLYVGGNIKATGELSVGDAVSTRANLGIGCTSLLSSALSSGSTTIDVSGYKAIVLIGKGGSATPSQTIIVPLDYLDSTEKSFSFTYGYQSQYTYIYLSISGSTVTIRFGGGSGALQAVYGVN